MKLKHSLMTLALATLGCLGLASAPATAAATGEEFAKASDDGAWCWFSEPKAVRRDGKVYTGWVTRDGSIEAGVIDAAGKVVQTAMLHEKLQLDDHNNPAFLFLADGRLAAFYCTHGNDDLFLRITEKPGDISAWSPIRRLGFLPKGKKGYGVTYANPAMLSAEANKLFVFFRGLDWKPTISTSTDQGQTWSEPRTLISRRDNTGGNRPYVKYWNNGKDRIDFLFTDGHPRNEAKNRIHFMRYEKGAFFKADGTKIGALDDLPIDPDKTDIVYDASAGRGWIWDIIEDAQGNPVIGYTRLPGDTKETMGRDHRYQVARWDGKAWIDSEIGKADKWFPQTPKDKVETEPHYSPGMALDPRDPAIAYYSAKGKTHLEIFKATTADGGKTWKSEPVTENSYNDNVRPYVVRGEAGASSVLWMNLRFYRHYIDYDVSMRMDLPATKPAISADLDPAAVQKTMEAVADWQLDHPSRHALTDWTQGAGDAGMMALAGLSKNPKYEDAMLFKSKRTDWKPGPRAYHADDHTVGQAYAELYFKAKKPAMLKGMQERFDGILAKPSDTVLDFKVKGNQARWSWCDALFMAPPAWIRLYAATGEKKYLDFMDQEWWVTTDYLYDKDEHLYYRDSTYFDKREANGKKIFWGRGNGWVTGGLVRVLQYLPKDHPNRAKYETLYKEMMAKLLECQQPDGLWRASLLDPASYPLKETSGSGFYCYGLAWGVNNGLLDRATYEPAVKKAWAALVGCVDAEGKLTHVQPIGADPKKFDQNGTEVYGVGAFLLAGAEIARLGQPAAPLPLVTPVTIKAAVQVQTRVTAVNPLDIARASETIEIPWQDGVAVVVKEGDKVVPCQVFEGKLLFQADFAAKEQKQFKLDQSMLVKRSGNGLEFVNDSSAVAVDFPMRAYGRYVPERMDDYAWENDRIAFRVYGPMLEQPAPKGEGLYSSSVDVWVKRTRGLVIDKWYKSKAYHADKGEGCDCYKCGTSRGCGGIGVWADGKLLTSNNWRTQKNLVNGPVRTVAEFTYAPWDCGNGVKIRETRRISLDAGSNLSRFESVFTIEGAETAKIAVGIDTNVAHLHGNGTIAGGAEQGWISNWEQENKPNGITGTAILIPNAKCEKDDADGNLLLITPATSGKPFVWYAGAGWSKSGDFADAKAWQAYVETAKQRIENPLKVTVGE